VDLQLSKKAPKRRSRGGNLIARLKEEEEEDEEREPDKREGRQDATFMAIEPPLPDHTHLHFCSSNFS
jgi:hypothetical protein